MKKQLCSFLLVLVCIARLTAQNAPSIEWQKSLGGSVYDYAEVIQQTPNGGFVIAGVCGSNDGDVSGNHGLADYWIVELDSSGNIQWQKPLGGSSLDRVYDLALTSDGGYIVTGGVSSNDGDVSGNHADTYGFPSFDNWVVKLDSSGNIQWQKSLGGSGDDEGQSVQQTSDGGFIVAASSNSNDGDVSGNHGAYDYWIVKLASSGDIQWQKSLGGSDWELAHSIQQTFDSGFIVTGYSSSNDGDVTGWHLGYHIGYYGDTIFTYDYWVVKLDSSGNIQWQKCLGGSDYDEAHSIVQIADGGYIVAGYSFSNDGDVSGNHGLTDFWIVRIDASGNLIWQKCLGGSSDDGAYSIQQTTDSGFIVGGSTYSIDGDVTGNHGIIDDWIVKMDSAGNIKWQKCLGGSNIDAAFCTQQILDGGFIVAGNSFSNDGDVSGNHGDGDCWIVKLSPDVPLGLPLISVELFSLYPNPTNGNITLTAKFTTPQSLEIKLTDIIGRELLSFDEGLVSGNFTTQYELSALSSGTYFLKIIHDGTSEVKKMEFEK